MSMYSELLSPLFRSCMAWPPHPIDNGAKWVTFVLSLLVLSVSHFSYDTSKMKRATERAAFCVSRWRSAVPAVSRRNRLKKRDYTYLQRLHMLYYLHKTRQCKRQTEYHERTCLKDFTSKIPGQTHNQHQGRPEERNKVVHL